MNRRQEGDQAGREDHAESHEQPVRNEETTREGDDTLGQGAANVTRARAAKVQGWRIPELPVHNVVRIYITLPEV